MTHHFYYLDIVHYGSSLLQWLQLSAWKVGDVTFLKMVLLAQFSLYMHKGGLKPHSFHFICIIHIS